MDDKSCEPQKAPGPPSATDDAPAHSPAAVQSLKDAMRRARVDDAERAGVLADLRAARIGRLEMLQDALKPLVAQIPKDVDYFDVAVVPGVNPRLFIDMIGFIEMGRDARLYRFLQDTRYGRTTLAESGDIDTMVEAVTNYVARRLLDRDKALAAEATEGSRAVRPATPEPTSNAPPTVTTTAADSQPAAPATRRGKFLGWVGIGFAFLIDLLGSITFFSILAALGWVLWNKLHGHV